MIMTKENVQGYYRKYYGQEMEFVAEGKSSLFFLCESGDYKELEMIEKETGKVYYYGTFIKEWLHVDTIKGAII